MKKLFVLALAAFSMVACVNEQITEMPNGGEISFENAFIDNATRVGYESANDLNAFEVWGFVKQVEGTIFNGTQVTRNGNTNAWTYTGTQYWAPGQTYYFAALAPVGLDVTPATDDAAAKTGLGTVEFTNVDGTTDVIYAQTMKTAADAGQTTGPVELTFNHLLSKVKFTFKNGFPSDAYNPTQVAISDVKMTVPEKGTIDLATAAPAWTLVGNTTIDLNFGTANNVELLTIPAGTEQTYPISFRVKLTINGVEIYDQVKTSAVSGVALEKGKAYNFAAEVGPETLDLEAIEFTVTEIKDWVETENVGVVVGEGYTYVEGTETYTATSAEGLLNIVNDINANDNTDANIVLGGDIDLSELAALTRAAVVSNWTPVGTSANPFKGTFDGNGCTIKNLTLVEPEAKEGKAYIGFFGYAKDATIKNVTFENVYINIPCLDIDHSQGHIGAVAGSLEGTSTIENVTVKGDIKVYATQTANGASRVAVVAGGNSYGDVTMKNVHVIANEGSYLTANNNTGALAGQLQGKMYFENCSSNINVTVNKFFAGGLVGIAAGDSKFVDCHTTSDVAVVAGREGRHNDEYRVGGIAGGWADGKTKVCTLENCSYTGNVSGVNADGSVADPLDYAGYVGRGYTLANCAGSTVIIDGVKYVQKYDNVYGKYEVIEPVSTADELIAALEAGNGVMFMNDIKIEPAKMSNAYGTTGINVKYGQTIDGNGYTLNIKGAGGTWDSGINTTGGLIKNLTVTGSFRGIFINHTSSYSEKVVLENVTIGGNGTVYTISCDQGLYQGIEATNCTFNGWTSFAKTAGEAKFVNCNFGEGSGYKYCRPYSNTEFVGCTFCPGYAVDQTRATVTFTDCTWEE